MSHSEVEEMAGVRLAKVRQHMLSYGMDAFIVFSGDAHKSEYVAEYDKRRAFLSGFTGSAGTAVLTQTEAALWTDGRYFNQASSELSKQWTLMKSGLPGVPEIKAWLPSMLSAGQTVGVDPSLISAKEAKDLKESLLSVNIKLVALTPLQPNPVDIVWNESTTSPRPLPPMSPARVHSVEYAGESHIQKIKKIQLLQRQKGAYLGIFSALDEIAWLFNLRGSDVIFNPVVKAYAVVFSDMPTSDQGDEESQPVKKQKIESKDALSGDVYLFINECKLTEDVSSHLLSGNSTVGCGNVVIKPYEEVNTFLTRQCQDLEKSKIILDSNSLNWGVYGAVDHVKDIEIIDAPSIVAVCKAIKNPVELQGIRACHVRDGAALTAYLCWLDGHMKSSDSSALTENEAASKLESFRAAMPLYVSLSFDTISSYGSNGAIIHYHPPHEGSAIIGQTSLYLVDSGGQYLDGTTDVTRTLYFGCNSFPEECPEGVAAAAKLLEMKNAHTYVLKAHITLATAKFPEDTMGYRLDAITRAPLWAAGLDYAHGTGHGVGSYLNVHEGPQGIGVRPRNGDMGFKAGMTTSNEPGYYKDGEYGIRIENICVTVDDNSSLLIPSSGKKFLGFETVTMCPLDRSLINTDLLSDMEVDWVNSYHLRVRTALQPVMAQYFPEAIPYLMKNTDPL